MKLCRQYSSRILINLFIALVFLPASAIYAQETSNDFDFLTYLPGTWTIEWTQGEHTFKEIDTFTPDVSGKFLTLDTIILRDGEVNQTGSGIVARDAGGTIHHSFAGSNGNVIRRTGRLQSDGTLMFDGLSFSDKDPFPFKIHLKDFTDTQYIYIFLQQTDGEWKESFRFRVKRVNQ